MSNLAAYLNEMGISLWLNRRLRQEQNSTVATSVAEGSTRTVCHRVELIQADLPCAWVWVNAQILNHAGALALFHKMINAMGLAHRALPSVGLAQVFSNATPTAVAYHLLLGEDLQLERTNAQGGHCFGQIQSIAGSNLVYTYSPLVLLETPSLKKDAWAHIKLFLKNI